LLSLSFQHALPKFPKENSRKAEKESSRNWPKTKPERGIKQRKILQEALGNAEAKYKEKRSKKSEKESFFHRGFLLS
jgi:hypothetical protein